MSQSSAGVLGRDLGINCRLPRLLYLLVAVCLLGSACSSESPDVADQSAGVGQATTSVVTETIGQPSPGAIVTWQDFASWDAGSQLLIDGDPIDLPTTHICFDDLCEDPVPYHETAIHLTVSVGAAIELQADALAQTSVTRRDLSSDLDFELLPPTDQFRFEQAGVSHIQIRGNVGLPGVEGRTQVAHNIWVTAAGPACPVRRYEVAATSGAFDPNGCPTDSVVLSLAALHPSFHCHPWPARITTNAQPGAVFTQVETVNESDLPADLVRLDVTIAGHGVLRSPSQPDSLWLASESTASRWQAEQSTEECL